MIGHALTLLVMRYYTITTLELRHWHWLYSQISIWVSTFITMLWMLKCVTNANLILLETYFFYKNLFQHLSYTLLHILYYVSILNGSYVLCIYFTSYLPLVIHLYCCKIFIYQNVSKTCLCRSLYRNKMRTLMATK